MTLSQKVVDFTARHQFSVIAGCWALGIAGAFGAIMRNPCVWDIIHGRRDNKLTRSRGLQVSKSVAKGMAQLSLLLSDS
jgi:hypothetical protein